MNINWISIKEKGLPPTKEVENDDESGAISEECIVAFQGKGHKWHYEHAYYAKGDGWASWFSNIDGEELSNVSHYLLAEPPEQR